MLLKNKIKFSFRVLLLYLFPILSWNAFLYVGFNLTVIKAIYIIAISFLFFYVFGEIKRKTDSHIRKIFKYLLCIITFSIIMSWLLWGQSIVLGYRATAPILAILYIFLLYKGNYSEEEIRKFINIQFIIYVILYFYALSKAPQVIFSVNTDTELNDDRGIFRISIANFGFVILAFFMYLNNWIESRSKKWLLLTLFAYSLIIMSVTRQVIAISTIIAIVYLLRKWKYIWILILISFICFNVISIKFSDTSIVGSLINLTNRQIEDNNSGETNVRLLEYEYYFTKYNNNPIAWIFGNGQFHVDSNFGKNELMLQEIYGYFQSDVGYARVFIQWGIIGLLIIVYMFYVPYKYQLSRNKSFLKLYIIYQILANFAASWIWVDVITICIVYYMIDNFSYTNRNLIK